MLAEADIAAVGALIGDRARAAMLNDAGFGNKRALLGALVERAVRGVDPRPVREQEAPRALAAATDQREQLRLFATDIAGRLDRAAPLAAVVSGAARSDPDLAEPSRASTTRAAATCERSSTPSPRTALSGSRPARRSTRSGRSGARSSTSCSSASAAGSGGATRPGSRTRWRSSCFHRLDM
jgi:hypothetical protein